MWAAVAFACTHTLASSFSSFGKEAAKEKAAAFKETAATMKEAALESAQVVAAPLNAAVVVLENCR